MDGFPRSLRASFVWANGTSNNNTIASTTNSVNATEHACKLSLLWNWNVKDSCFIAPNVRINNKVQFALVCLGVVLIAVILQFLRRVCRTYDRILLRNRDECRLCYSSNRSDAVSVSNSPSFFVLNSNSWSGYPNSASLAEQAVRAMLRTLALATSYLILGFALSFNGYIIVCILLGTWVGDFAFGRDSLPIFGNYGAGCCDGGGVVPGM